MISCRLRTSQRPVAYPAKSRYYVGTCVLSLYYKKRFEAQQILVALGMLARNALIWAREWLAAAAPQLRRFGVKRLVRDAFGIAGVVTLDQHGRVGAIVLNHADRLAHHLLAALQALLSAEQIGVSLGET
jgi:hypothetical protein